jgi:hypothetical protein
MMSPTLRSLCINPLLLRLTLDYWKREHDFPRKIEFMFRSWLDTVLETEPSDVVSKVQRERALTALAEATSASPITSVDAVARLNDRAIPAIALDELIHCNAVRMTGLVVELQHEGLGDYLRAKALAAMSETDLFRVLPTLPVPADSFFPVLLMAQLPGRRLQSALWKRLAEGRIGIYLDALRYRFDVSGELRELDPEKLSQEYLSDLIDGIEVPLILQLRFMALPPYGRQRISASGGASWLWVRNTTECWAGVLSWPSCKSVWVSCLGGRTRAGKQTSISKVC